MPARQSGSEACGVIGGPVWLSLDLATAAPFGSRATVIGVAEDCSRVRTPILQAELAAEDGYFGERLAAGRAELVRVWRARAACLTPSPGGTDIIGAMQLGHELVVGPSRRPNRNVVVIFSEMRNAAAILNLETPHLESPDAMLRMLKRRTGIADLTGVTVYVIGANGGGKDIRDWQTIKRFWIACFRKAGARCAGYSTLIPLPTLAP